MGEGRGVRGEGRGLLHFAHLKSQRDRGAKKSAPRAKKATRLEACKIAARGLSASRTIPGAKTSSGRSSFSPRSTARTTGLPTSTS